MDSDTDTSSSEEEWNEPWEEAAHFYMGVRNHAVQVRGPGQMFGVNLGGGIRMVTHMHIGRGVHLGAGAQVNDVRVNLQPAGVRLLTIRRVVIRQVVQPGGVQQRVNWLGGGHRGGVRLGPNRQGGVRQGRVQRRDQLRQRRGRLELCRRCGKIHRAGACTGSRPVAAPHERNRECTICLEAVGAAGGDDVVLRCGHVFHYACVAPWCRRRSTCPVCRSRLEQRD